MATYDKNEIIYATNRNFNELRKKILAVYNARLLGNADSKLSSFSKYNDVNIEDLAENQNSTINYEHALRTINAMVGAQIDQINSENILKIPQVEKQKGDIIPALTDLWTVVNDWGTRGENNHGCNAACSGFCTGASQSKNADGPNLPGNQGENGRRWWHNDNNGCSNLCDTSCGGSITGHSSAEGPPEALCYSASCTSCCYGNCGSCTGKCVGNCGGGCLGNCYEGCVSSCESDCVSYCGSGCSGGCNGGCTGCSTTCQNGCGIACQGTCQYGSS